MKSEKEIKEMIEKLTHKIKRDEEYLKTANGDEITLKNRIALHEEITEWKHRKSMLEWLFAKEPTKAMLDGLIRCCSNFYCL